jgi:peptidoglycan hydrolase CwlO-like protein
VDPTVITGGLLAVAAIVSSATPIVLARRRASKDALAAARTDAVEKSDLTLTAWTELNRALQQEIARLQAVVDRCQARVEALEAEIYTIRHRNAGQHA